jgi:hypothetical protein
MILSYTKRKKEGEGATVGVGGGAGYDNICGIIVEILVARSVRVGVLDAVVSEVTSRATALPAVSALPWIESELEFIGGREERDKFWRACPTIPTSSL